MTDPDWLTSAYAAGTVDAADGEVVALDDGIGDALHAPGDFRRNLAEVDRGLATVDPSRLCPVMAIGILRFTFPLHDMLTAWPDLRDRIRADLSARPGLDVGELLRGL